MFFLQTFIVSGDKDYLIGKLITFGGLPPESKKDLQTLPLETLVKKIGDLNSYYSGSASTKAPGVSIYFLRIFDSPLKILVSVTGHPDFYCSGPQETVNALKNLGLEIDPDKKTAIYHSCFDASFVFFDGLLDSPLRTKR